jgi:hypothetical protein
LGFARKGSTAA